jgi:hypothetical protein
LLDENPCSGGLVGKAEETMVISSFWNQDSGSLGFMDNGFGNPLTTEQMQDPNTYLNAGWDLAGYTQNGYQDLWLAEDGNYPQLTLNASDEKYGGGSGEPNDPYLIYNPQHFWNIAGTYMDIWRETLDFDKHFKLVRDINLEFLTGNDYRSIGYEDKYDYFPFTGVFDGNNHAIKNFTNLIGDEYGDIMVGLFEYVDDPNATIKNLALEDCNITGPGAALVGNLIQGSIQNCNVLNSSLQGNNIGAIASEVEYGTISDCHADVNVISDYGASGLVQYLSEGSIDNCSSKVYMQCGRNSGGLVAFNENGTISNSHAQADIYYFYGGGRAGTNSVGGLVGNNHNSIINCYAVADIYGHNLAGGLVGLNIGNIEQSYAKGFISGHDTLGGLVGQNSSLSSSSGLKIGTIFNCYSKVTIVGHEKIGGLVGFIGGTRGGPTSSNIINCYSASLMSGAFNTGGLVGNDAGEGQYAACFWDSDLAPDVNGIGSMDEPNVMPRTTPQMQVAETFTDYGWDFVNETTNGIEDIWWIEEANYPKLWWQRENTPPIAVPGPNQTVYAWIDGYAEVFLDGSASYDLDSDSNDLTYLWTWSIDGSRYESNDINFTALLPVGFHTFELVVNDGIDDSEPNYCDVNVIEPLYLHNALEMTHKKIVSHAKGPKQIKTHFTLPDWISQDDIIDQPFLLCTSSSDYCIESISVKTHKHKGKYQILFSKDDLMNIITDTGTIELNIVAQLNTGQYIYATDSITIK